MHIVLFKYLKGFNFTPGTHENLICTLHSTSKYFYLKIYLSNIYFIVLNFLTAGIQNTNMKTTMLSLFN